MPTTAPPTTPSALQDDGGPTSNNASQETGNAGICLECLHRYTSTTTTTTATNNTTEQPPISPPSPTPTCAGSCLPPHSPPSPKNVIITSPPPPSPSPPLPRSSKKGEPAMGRELLDEEGPKRGEHRRRSNNRHKEAVRGAAGKKESGWDAASPTQQAEVLDVIGCVGYTGIEPYDEQRAPIDGEASSTQDIWVSSHNNGGAWNNASRSSNSFLGLNMPALRRRGRRGWWRRRREQYPQAEPHPLLPSL